MRVAPIRIELGFAYWCRGSGESAVGTAACGNVRRRGWSSARLGEDRGRRLLVCERAQRGIRSRAFDQGVLPWNDRLLHLFAQRYLNERDGQ